MHKTLTEIEVLFINNFFSPKILDILFVSFFSERSLPWHYVQQFATNHLHGDFRKKHPKFSLYKKHVQNIFSVYPYIGPIFIPAAFYRKLIS